MLTGAQYKESLKDGRATYIDGDRVTDPANHPLLKTAVDVSARVYDSFYSADPGAFNPLYIIPRSLEEYRERGRKLAEGESDMALGTTSTIILALSTAAAELGHLKPEYRERIYNFIDYARKNDLRCAEVVTDSKGHRKKRPNQQSDPDFYVHAVDRNADGVYITGAKMHISAASIEHELVVLPTKAMRPGEEEYAIACSVPVNAPGVSIIDATYAPRGEDVRHYPISSKRNCPEGFVIFDHVFVPNERVFLDGEVSHATTLAHSLGLWERAAGIEHSGDAADRQVGMAALLAEANGVADEPHIRDKLATLVIWATMCRAGGEAAMVNARTNEDGNMSPSPLFVSALKYYRSEFTARVIDILHDIAGTLVVNAPTMADFDNPELRPALEESLATNGFTAEERLKLFHYLRDTTADAYGGCSVSSPCATTTWRRRRSSPGGASASAARPRPRTPSQCWPSAAERPDGTGLGAARREPGRSRFRGVVPPGLRRGSSLAGP
jgi:4-hydroxybutyryl-CoA dehydratase/vinylacetyl-CoA-Delta-isomerase